VDRPPCRFWPKLVAGATLGPTGYGNSPYQSLSSFAGNELLISPEWLIEDGLLHTSDCRSVRSLKTKSTTTLSFPFKYALTERAWANFSGGARSDLRAAYEQFRREPGALAGGLRALPGAKSQVR